ncbi:MAG: VOC family protein [Lactovum sp.]
MKNLLNMVVSDAIAASQLYVSVFDATLGEVFEFPDRPKSNEVNVSIGQFHLRLVDENIEFDCLSPKKDEVDSIWLSLQVDDAKCVLKKAKTHGMEIVTEMQEHLGQKFFEVKDPFAYTWVISQTIREVSYEEKMAFYNDYHSGLDLKKEKE